MASLYHRFAGAFGFGDPPGNQCGTAGSTMFVFHDPGTQGVAMTFAANGKGGVVRSHKIQRQMKKLVKSIVVVVQKFLPCQIVEFIHFCSVKGFIFQDNIALYDEKSNFGIKKSNIKVVLATDCCIIISERYFDNF